MSDYIDALIPLLIGILGITSAHSLVKPGVVDRAKKVSIIRNCGWALAGLGVIFGLMKFFSH